MTTVLVRGLILIAFGYLLGSIPSGVIAGKITGVDIRKMGSGKTGATNVLRSAGIGAALIVAVGDVLKGLIPVLLGLYGFTSSQALGAFAAWSPWLACLAGLAAMMGHNYPVFAGFQGGRGVATTAGISFGFSWLATLLAAIFFFLPIMKTKYVSLGSMIGAVSLPLIEIILSAFHLTGKEAPAATVAMTIAALYIVFSHRDNINRIRSGTERRLGEKAKPVINV